MLTKLSLARSNLQMPTFQPPNVLGPGIFRRSYAEKKVKKNEVSSKKDNTQVARTSKAGSDKIVMTHALAKGRNSGSSEKDLTIDSSETDVRCWLIDNKYGERVVNDLKGADGKKLLGYSDVQLGKIIGKVDGFDLWNKLHTQRNEVELIYELIIQGNYTPPTIPTPNPVFFGRKDALNVVRKYIEGVIAKLKFSFVENKYVLLGTSGMKGIGKTELLYQIGAQITKVSETNVRSVYISFNGGPLSHKSNFLKLIKGSTYIDSFGQLLLDTCGVPEDLKHRLNFATSLATFRSISKMAEEDILLVLVDEIGSLDTRDAEGTISALMSAMDACEGKVIFIFSHVIQSFLKQQTTISGRTVMLVPLSPLPIDVWKNVPGLAEAARKSPALHQLFLSCSGHPRSIFQGIERAREKNTFLLTDPNATAINNARYDIIETSKFDENTYSMIEDAVMVWYSSARLNPATEELWSYSGLLHTVFEPTTMEPRDPDNRVQFLFPLLVLDWARKFPSPIGYHLQQLYEFDASLDLHTEKIMDSVMYHYDAVLRIAHAERPVLLGSFFNALHRGKLEFESATALVPLVDRPPFGVKEVTNFRDETILSPLAKGCIVVSKDPNEVGIEYLVPFRNDKFKLMLACVQCKFVTSNADWADISKKMKMGIDALSKVLKGDFQFFPVIYTTSDQQTLRETTTTLEDAFYFTASDLFKHTKKLGILRLHTQKLGKVLSSEYPFLIQASTEPPVKHEAGLVHDMVESGFLDMEKKKVSDAVDENTKLYLDLFNNGTKEEIVKCLLHLGPAKAGFLIEKRERNGPYKSIKDIHIPDKISKKYASKLAKRIAKRELIFPKNLKSRE